MGIALSDYFKIRSKIRQICHLHKIKVGFMFKIKYWEKWLKYKAIRLIKFYEIPKVVTVQLLLIRLFQWVKDIKLNLT